MSPQSPPRNRRGGSTDRTEVNHMITKLEALQKLQAVKQAKPGRCAPSTCIFTSAIHLP
ncbi:hypothetical protein GCM10010532_085240 [Dactylosporangium siamense]|uniref:Uncharacterized protein n=1 Tax=Dactylosporangium siamense TaxID=685454 RepID=A0A919PRC3_9ACTN|nr:hypothetical protein Dsi01nite_068580 [Dactylosporangium siamense]